MAYSNRKVGFSTGALAKGDFQRALEILRNQRIEAVELSALREFELEPLISSLPSLDLSGFSHVSIHAPSKLERTSEVQVVELLQVALRMEIGIVVHPDTIVDSDLWKGFGRLLWIENLDKRKCVARTSFELEKIFDAFPEAGFCLDVAHARQIDPTMSEATRMILSFDHRIRQIHASGLNSNSTHSALSTAASYAFGQISDLIRSDIPIILESPIEENAISGELAYAREAFSPGLYRLRSNIDDVFHFRVPSLRRTQLETFLSILQSSGIRLCDFSQVVLQLPTGGPYKPGNDFLDATALLRLLSPKDIDQLKQHLNLRVEQVASEFPDLAETFKEQFI